MRFLVERGVPVCAHLGLTPQSVHALGGYGVQGRDAQAVDTLRRHAQPSMRNLVDCAELVVRSALMRHESRGLHYSRDFPNPLPVSFPTVLTRPARSEA